MNGATLVLAMNARMPKRPTTIRIGRSHHFLLCFKKSISSTKRLGWASSARSSRSRFSAGSVVINRSSPVDSEAASELPEVAVQAAVGVVRFPVARRLAVEAAPEGIAPEEPEDQA